jgi:hypothetical protein
MKSKELFKQVVYKVNCQYGASMGRASYDERKNIVKERFFDRAVPLCGGGYDKGGAYWGFPSNLRVRYNASLTYVLFYRK